MSDKPIYLAKGSAGEFSTKAGAKQEEREVAVCKVLARHLDLYPSDSDVHTMLKDYSVIFSVTCARFIVVHWSDLVDPVGKQGSARHTIKVLFWGIAVGALATIIATGNY